VRDFESIRSGELLRLSHSADVYSNKWDYMFSGPALVLTIVEDHTAHGWWVMTTHGVGFVWSVDIVK
jgi:hypothetical protein